MHVLTMALLAERRYLLPIRLHIFRYDCGLFMTGTLTLTHMQVRLRPVHDWHPNPNTYPSRFDCGLFMTGTRGELFATHVIALFIQVRSA